MAIEKKGDYSDVYKAPEIKEKKLSKRGSNKYHISDIDLNIKPITRKEIAFELQKIHSKFSEKEIEDLIKSYEALMKKELISKGRFRINGVLEVESVLYNKNRNMVERVKHIEEPTYIIPPVTVRLRSRISKSLKEDYRWARRYEETRNLKVPFEDWYKPFLTDEIPSWVKGITEVREKYNEDRSKKIKKE